MSEGLLKALMWMPKVKTFCGAGDLKCGATCSLCIYTLLCIFIVLKPIFLIRYHHDCETSIAYAQFVFTYIAAFCGFFAFYTGIPMFATPTSDDKDKAKCNIRNSIFSHAHILLCVVVSVCEIVWGTLTFARAFIEPGLVSVGNKSRNPYPEYEVCKKDDRYRGSRTKTRHTTCRPVTEEEKRKREQWDLDHANDSVLYEETKTFDATSSAFYTLLHVYAFYLLITFRSYLLELLEEQEEQTEQSEEEEEE